MAEFNINGWEDFKTQWFTVKCPDKMAGHVEAILVQTIGKFVRAITRPPVPASEDQVYMTVGAPATNTRFNRILLLKQIVRDVAKVLPPSCTIYALQMSDTGEYPGVPITPDEKQTKPWPGRDKMGIPLDEESEGAETLREMMQNTEPEGEVVIDMEMKGEFDG